MIPDERDTIVAAATPRAGAARGIVRLSGPNTLAVVNKLLSPRLGRGIGLDIGIGAHNDPPAEPGAERIGDLSLSLSLAGREQRAPVDLFLWRGTRSYTRQPSAELHTLGSPPVVDAIVEAACGTGARLAEPGEFTLRAFLAGRIDLTQAEAVLGVIDAPGGAALNAALGQLAGGLSRPLNQLRNDLLNLLAELEAGLDFVDEEDIRFIEEEELTSRLRTATEAVAMLIEQTELRGRRAALPRVALVGPPNAGKSSLFNALRARFGVDKLVRPTAIVSSEAGTTRDSLITELNFEGLRFELLDTAGVGGVALSGPGAIADQHARRDASTADLCLRCHPLEASGANSSMSLAESSAGDLLVLTKSDTESDAVSKPTPSHCAILTSSMTGAGIDELIVAVRRELSEQSQSEDHSIVAETAERCRRSLLDAHESLLRSLEIVGLDEHDLIALELRAALEDLGQVVGAVVTDDILDRIFGQFCIGK